MSQLEENRDDLLALAAGTLLPGEQQRVEALIHSDAECRQFWESLEKLTVSLNDDANRGSVPCLPLGFHKKLLRRLDKLQHSPVSPFEKWIKTITKPLIATATIILLGFAIKIGLPKPTSQPKESVQVSHNSKATQGPEASSWAALRATTTDPTPLLVSIPQKITKADYPSMGWADRERWIEQYDL